MRGAPCSSVPAGAVDVVDWHSITVGVLVFALLLETFAAYCRQNETLRQPTGVPRLGRTWWQWPWVTAVGPPPAPGLGETYGLRYPTLGTEIASLTRGVSRLTVGAWFLARIVAKQPPLPIVDFCF